MRYSAIFCTAIGVLSSTAMSAPAANAQDGGAAAATFSNNDEASRGRGDEMPIDQRNSSLPSTNGTMEFDHDDGKFEFEDDDRNDDMDNNTDEESDNDGNSSMQPRHPQQRGCNPRGGTRGCNPGDQPSAMRRQSGKDNKNNTGDNTDNDTDNDSNDDDAGTSQQPPSNMTSSSGSGSS